MRVEYSQRYTCQVCGKETSSEQQKNKKKIFIPTCAKCQTQYCNKCGKGGFCLKCLNALPPKIRKQHLAKIRNWKLFGNLFGALFIVSIIVSLIDYFNDNMPELIQKYSDYVLFISFFLALIIIGIASRRIRYLQTEKATKIVQILPY